MSALLVEILQLPHARDLPLPQNMSEQAAGFDLTAAVTEPMILAPGAFSLVPTGISIALPDGFEAQIRPRSGLAAKHGITVLNSPGTIDADYRGEIKIILINHGPASFVVERGERIAQMVVAPVTRVSWTKTEHLPPSARGEKGFGSTGTASDGLRPASSAIKK